MEEITLRDLSFAYPESKTYSLYRLSFTVYSGDFIVVCGPSGCGKSTLLRHFKTCLAPHGKKYGELLFDGVPLSEISFKEQSSRIGFVTQSPDNQIVTDKVWHELAFGLESLGTPTQEIRRRVAEMASFFGIQNWFYKDVSELSGGQKQLLNLASIMCMQPELLILDEPTSQLDPIAASDFLSMVAKINRELGVTVILTEHRLEEVFPYCTSVCVLQNGKLAAFDEPAEVGRLLKNAGSGMLEALPAAMRAWFMMDGSGKCPITAAEGKQWLESFCSGKTSIPVPYRERSLDEAPVAIELQNIYFSYPHTGVPVLKDLNIQVHYGELFALLGGNGAGKTTMLNILSGLYSPDSGHVLLDGENLSDVKDLFRGKMGVLPQNPQALFVENSVESDLKEVLRGLCLSDDEERERLKGVVGLCHLEGLLNRHPYDLSGGEMQRAAFAKVLLLQPKILLLDEPTKGLDASFKKDFSEILRFLLNEGVCILMVSHDVEFCAAQADSCGMVFDGQLIAQNSPRIFFSDNAFYTTTASKMARRVCPGAVIPEEIAAAFGYSTALGKGELNLFPEYVLKEDYSAVKEKKTRLSKRTILAAVLIVAAIPFTFYIGYRYMGERKLLFITLLILLESMLPFFLVFEGRKPQPREMVLIAVLCAIGVASRAALYMVPYFKPVMALVIISGAALGGETGFLVGSLTILLSNMLYGQGMWTPWQMFTMGIIGFLAGILFHNKKAGSSRALLCIFGFLSAVIIYGGILNPASAIMAGIELNWKVFLSYEIAGVPVDLIHASATALFLFFAAKPMMEKLERIQEKYGMIQ